MSDKYTKRDEEDRRSPRRDERDSNYDNQSNESGKRGRTEEPREVTDKRSIYVGNLTDNVTEEDLRKLFGEFGTIEDVRFAWKDRFAKIHKGFCFVQFANEDEAKKANELNGKVVDGQEIKTSMAGEGKVVRHSIFVGNLSYQTNKDSLIKMFEDCGKITKVHVPQNPDGTIVGYAFIDFEGPEEVQRALRLNDTDVDGRRIRVELGGNKKKSDRGGRGGFGGDRRDDRRGGYGERRDDRRGGDRRDDRRGGYERRDDRDSGRRDYGGERRGGYERRDDRDSGRRDYGSDRRDRY